MSYETYKLLFWVSVAYHIVRTRIYIGSDEKKYEASDIGLLLRK